MSEDNYMSDITARSVKGFIEALTIFSKYMPHAEDTKFFLGAEHDEIFMYDVEGLTLDSEDGQRVNALGFHFDGEDSWSYFT